MLKIILIALSLFFAEGAFSQVIYAPCKDSNKVENIFYPCFVEYDPVCGCDGVTYRDWCAAENKYALNQGNYIEGPCTDFHYDISPNQVFDFLKIKIRKKTAGYFVVNIFDTYGHQFYTRAYPYSDLFSNYLQIEIPMFGFRQGLYILEVVTDSEQKIEKFFKVNY